MQILLVEDNPGDARLFQTALAESSTGAHISVACDGQAALDFLGAHSTPGDSLRPNLVVLDLNLPGVHGHEVLRQVKLSKTLRDIPVVVFSTSEYEQDVAASYRNGAASYLVKPVSLEEYLRTIEVLLAYWGRNVTPAQRED